MEIDFNSLEGNSLDFLPFISEEKKEETVPTTILASQNTREETLQRLRSEMVYQPNIRSAILTSEQAFIKCVTSKEYVNTVIQFEYNHTTYPIRVIHNPEKKQLWGGNLSRPLRMTHVVVGEVPPQLQHQLENILLNHQVSFDANEIELRGRSALSIEEWEEVSLVHVGSGIEDPHNDALLAEILQSNTFRNEVLYYSIDGYLYRVRIIYNPHEETCSATEYWSLGGKPEQPITISWNKKYGIFCDFSAPKELIDHLAAPMSLSWWDWYFNYKVENGTKVEITEGNYNYNIIYTLGKWFFHAEDLAPLS